MHNLLLKSLPYDKREWIEECFLRLLWMVSSAAKELEIPEEACITAMNDMLACLKDRGIESVSQEGTHVFFTVRTQNMALILHSTDHLFRFFWAYLKIQRPLLASTLLRSGASSHWTPESSKTASRPPSLIFRSTFTFFGSHSGTNNFYRKLATVAFSNNNLVLAQQTLDQIQAENETKSDLQVQCLLFKLALHDEKDIHCE